MAVAMLMAVPMVVAVAVVVKGEAPMEATAEVAVAAAAVVVVVELVVPIEYNKNGGLNQFLTVACAYHEAVLGNFFGLFCIVIRNSGSCTGFLPRITNTR